MIDDRLTERMRDWRHDLHRHPELAFEEVRTAELVADTLAGLGYAIHRGLGRTGIVATRHGHGDRSSAIGLRADMDALPMQEQGAVPHRSTVDGRFHGCGHDGHVAMLLGAAVALADREPPLHDVHLIFQPAEEGAGGARAMIDDGLFDLFPMDAVHGLHNMPGLPIGHFAIRAGPMMASFDHFEIHVQGHGGHAAMPHHTRDPLLAAAQIAVALQSIASRNVDPLDSAVLSVTTLRAGSAVNVIPGEARLAGTVRSLAPAVRERVEQRLHEIASHVAQAHATVADVGYTQAYPVLVNDARQVGVAATAARAVARRTAVDETFSPLMGSEDFAFMLQRTPGAYMLIGAGDGDHGCMVHDPCYDFNDAILPLGAAYWLELVMSKRWCQTKRTAR